MSTNLVIVSGTLSKHELRYTPKGTPLLEVSLVGKRQVGENHIFFRADLTYWGKQAEGWAEALQEGAAYQATGRLEYDSWEVDGVKASRVRIIGDDLLRLEQADVRQEEKGPMLYGAENRVILVGGLTADPEVRQTPQKTPVAKANLGFSTWDREVKVERSHYLELEAWRDLAAQFADLKKGTPVLVEGSLKLESWEDKSTGLKRYRRLLEVQRVTKLTRIKPVFADAEVDFSEDPLAPTPPKAAKKSKAA
ncbi:MAG: single-stranded DNA-binding protein [Meiothermus sp.]|nr:single-stranded DNA-binding protein [Meiothermus sp.]